MSVTRRLVLPAVLTQREAPTALGVMVAAGVAAQATSGGEASRPILASGGPGPSEPGARSSGQAPSSWSIDASALTDFDSSALAVLMACKRLATAAQCALVIDSPPPKLVRLAGLYGLDEVLLGEAIAAQDAADLTA